ncbi:SGNH/GDSL hydrolase family protein [Streptacidiphilus sp. PAMC 29251]
MSTASPAAYSAETATAIANGSTTKGYIENSSYVGWDGAVPRFSQQSLLDQLQYLIGQQRRAHAAFRKEWRTEMGITPKATVKVMVCGDSITAGLGSSDGIGYPGWMIEHLDQQNIAMQLSYNAQGGWSLPNIMAGMAAALTAQQPDIVTIHIGTNDAGNTAHLAAYQTNLVTLLNQILSFTPAVTGVVCALIPISQGVTATYQQGEADVNTKILAAVAAVASPRVTTADCRATAESVTNSIDTWPGVATPPGRHTFDGMHPYDSACAKTSEAMLAAAAAAGWLPGYTA